jgi:hypothetical protein
MKTTLKLKLLIAALALMALALPQPASAQVCEWVVGIDSSDDYCRFSCPSQPCSCTDVDDGHWYCCCGQSV